MQTRINKDKSVKRPKSNKKSQSPFPINMLNMFIRNFVSYFIISRALEIKMYEAKIVRNVQPHVYRLRYRSVICLSEIIPLLCDYLIIMYRTGAGPTANSENCKKYI